MTKCWNIHIFKLASQWLFFTPPLWLASSAICSDTSLWESAAPGRARRGGMRAPPQPAGSPKICCGEGVSSRRRSCQGAVIFQRLAGFPGRKTHHTNNLVNCLGVSILAHCWVTALLSRSWHSPFDILCYSPTRYPCAPKLSLPGRFFTLTGTLNMPSTPLLCMTYYNTRKPNWSTVSASSHRVSG